MVLLINITISVPVPMKFVHDVDLDKQFLPRRAQPLVPAREAHASVKDEAAILLQDREAVPAVL